MIRSFAAATAPSGASGATSTSGDPAIGTWTERYDAFTTSGGGVGLSTFDAIKATAGATGNFSLTAGSSARGAIVAGAFKRDCMMIRHLLALCAVSIAACLAAPAHGQTITVSSPLPDKDGDGRVTVSAMAAQLGVPKGTVLARCGETLVYVGPKTACPVGAAALPVVEPAKPLPPRTDKPGTFASTRFLGKGSTVRNMTFAGLGTITRPRGRDEGVTISDVTATGASYLVRTYTAGDVLPSLTVSRVVMLDNGAGGILVRGASSGTITDVRIIATHPNTDCGKVPEGIALAGKGTGDVGGPWTIARVHIEGIRSTGCSFLNGDGIAVERGYQNGTIADAYMADNSDAGFDIKSPTFRLDRTVAERNRRNYKFWANQIHGTLTSIDPGQPGSGAAAHIQLQGTKTETRTMHIAKLIVKSGNTTPIFQVENGPWAITVDACDIKVPTGTPMLVGGAKGNVLTLGPGCKVSS